MHGYVLRLHGPDGLRLEQYDCDELLDVGDEITVPGRGRWRVVEATGPLEGTFMDGVADVTPVDHPPGGE